MADPIAKKTLNGSRASKDDQGHVFVVDSYFVNGLVEDQNLYEQALDIAQLPKLGDAHPNRETAVVTSVDIEQSGGTNNALAKITYRGTTDTTAWQIGSNAAQVGTDFDVNGSQITIADYTHVPTGGSSTAVPGANVTIQVLRPKTSVRLVKTINVDALTQSAVWTGVCNDGTFLNTPAYTWLILGIQATLIGEIDSQPQMWTATYDLGYQTQFVNGEEWGWRQLAVLKDASGAPTKGQTLPTLAIRDGKGTKLVDPYLTGDFASIGLP